jgi:hypothetical protein
VATEGDTIADELLDMKYATIELFEAVFSMRFAARLRTEDRRGAVVLVSIPF